MSLVLVLLNLHFILYFEAKQFRDWCFFHYLYLIIPLSLGSFLVSKSSSLPFYDIWIHRTIFQTNFSAWAKSLNQKGMRVVCQRKETSMKIGKKKRREIKISHEIYWASMLLDFLHIPLFPMLFAFCKRMFLPQVIQIVSQVKEIHLGQDTKWKIRSITDREYAWGIKG